MKSTENFTPYSFTTIDKFASLHMNKFRNKHGKKEHSIDDVSPFGICFHDKKCLHYVSYGAFLECYVWLDGSPCGEEVAE